MIAVMIQPEQQLVCFESSSIFPQVLYKCCSNERWLCGISLASLPNVGDFFSQQNPKDLVEVAAVALEEVAVSAVVGLVVAAVAALVVVDRLASEAFSKQECQSSDLLRVEMLVRKTLQFLCEKVNDIA